MRFVRVSRPAGPDFAALHDDGAHVVLLQGHPFGEWALTDQVAPLSQVQLLAPVLPSKVVCLGRNYAAHATEMGDELPAEPLIFLKPSTSVIGPAEPIRLPALSEEVHHEAELAVVIGALCRKVPVEDAARVVLGYTCANDVTARDLQRRDGQWARAKGFDTFCPLGPWIDTDFDPTADARVTCRVNGEVRQDASLRDMVFSVAEQIAYISAFTTLLPGDVILTGTPAGVGPIVAGDAVEVEVEQLGILHNDVVDD